MTHTSKHRDRSIMMAMAVSVLVADLIVGTIAVKSLLKPDPRSAMRAVTVDAPPQSMGRGGFSAQAQSAPTLSSAEIEVRHEGL